jgi:hypothetical protein
MYQIVCCSICNDVLVVQGVLVIDYYSFALKLIIIVFIACQGYINIAQIINIAGYINYRWDLNFK